MSAETWALDASACLGESGPFVARIPGFAPRAEQQAMARAVEAAIADGQTLVCEAGTGTGKTFAYLVPALRSERRVIISTGTRNLQDQLFHRDLPMVRDALGVSVRAVLLKGRANYLCLHRLATTLADGRFPTRAQAAQLQAVSAWSRRTRSGDIAELEEIPENWPAWPRVTSTADNCLSQECPSFTECFLHRARRAAQEADVVVVNHHLLFADMTLKEQGFGELLPEAEVVIVDEAHQLPATAMSYFGQQLTSRQLTELARDSRAERVRDAPEASDLEPRIDALEKAVRDFRLAFGAEPRRGAWERERGALEPALAELRGSLDALGGALRGQAARGKGLESCWRRAEELTERLAWVGGEAQAGWVRWFELSARGFALHATPLDVSEAFQAHMLAAQRVWVFTSATLAVDGAFEHFAEGLGLETYGAERWGSPFDYARQSLLYLPSGLPDPASPGYTARVVEVAREVVEASRGRAFLLFTSHRALREAAERLSEELPYPLLVQGEAPKLELLRRFRAAGNAVLLGTNSFWEGVDVRGEALSCVVIDRLPFASPGDPVTEARIAELRAEGHNPFLDYQLPQAVLALKQGAGRLIRDSSDRGVLVLCDPRLRARSYGRAFLASLPPMPLTDDPDQVRRFYTEPDSAGMPDDARAELPAAGGVGE